MSAKNPCLVPTPQELRAAEGKTIRDVIAPGLDVLFSGINPGLYSAAVGHHFARPGNRFWKALAGAGFTPRVLAPCEDRELPKYGCGITNLVARATAAADELSDEEFIAGRPVLLRKVRRYKPRVLAVLGISAFRVMFHEPHARPGPQALSLGPTRLWILPNPSGLNANYQVADLVRLFKALKAALR